MGFTYFCLRSTLNFNDVRRIGGKVLCGFCLFVWLLFMQVSVMKITSLVGQSAME